MRINKDFTITKKHDGTIITNLLAKKHIEYIKSDNEYYYLDRVVHIVRKYSFSENEKNRRLKNIYVNAGWFNSEEEIEKRLIKSMPTIMETSPDGSVPVDMTAVKKAICQRLIDFFSEFNFSPSFRFINTLALVNKPVDYVRNYFEIQDHQYTSEVREKVKSAEFKDILTSLKTLTKPVNVINSRMKIYYGEPGTGKTTQAINEASKLIVCSSDMLPKDLMQNFNFTDGKAEFAKSDLWIAMEEGTKIVLDEINMLPFETARFLQGLTDGKAELNFNGVNIKIKDGFQIIGTMNLNISGATMSIPGPLADRCSEITEFKLNADNLMAALA